MRFVMGILGVVVGFIFVWKTEPIVQFIGYSQWAEKWMGTEGGTRLMYKLIGILFIFIGLLAITGLYDNFLEATLGKLFSPKIGG